jgi:hypothetical protein
MSAIAMMFVLLLFDIAVITAVPLPPQPMMPSCTFDAVILPFTIDGAMNEPAVTMTEFLINERLSI